MPAHSQWAGPDVLDDAVASLVAVASIGTGSSIRTSGIRWRWCERDDGVDAIIRAAQADTSPPEPCGGPGAGPATAARHGAGQAQWRHAQRGARTVDGIAGRQRRACGCCSGGGCATRCGGGGECASGGEESEGCGPAHRRLCQRRRLCTCSVAWTDCCSRDGGSFSLRQGEAVAASG
jgi:hypothetical protein